MNTALEQRVLYDGYSYLWGDDRNEIMRQFLTYNHVLEAEEMADILEEEMPKSPPSLQQFREQVE